MNFFDGAVISFLNQFAKNSIVFDNFIVFLFMENLFKGGVVVAIYWWFWFNPSKDKNRNRTTILAGMSASFVALFLGRLLQLTLPFRKRPLHDVTCEFVSPYGMDPTIMTTWNSFPSDHGILFLALVTGIAFLSRKAGIAACIYVTFLILLPRIYVGVHYPTDILAGCAIGVFLSCLFNRPLLKNRISGFFIRYEQTRPGLFYVCFFAVSYLITTLFIDIRNLFSFGWLLFSAS